MASGRTFSNPRGVFLRRSDGSRALTVAEREAALDALTACGVAPGPVCRAAVEATRLVPRAPRVGEIRGPRSLIAHVALAARADGITLGRRVFVRAALRAPDGALPLDLVVHEVAHVAQVLRDGPATFYARYVADYLRGRARGLADHDAYLAIPYEVEAREVAARVSAARRIG